MDTADPNTFCVSEAKAQFSQLLERVAAGEEITITRNGRPAARLVPALLAYSDENRMEAILGARHDTNRP